MDYKCELYHQEAQPLLSIRRRASVEQLSVVIGEVFQTIGAYLGELGEQPGGAPFVAYHNLDMQDLDLANLSLGGLPHPHHPDPQRASRPPSMHIACKRTGVGGVGGRGRWRSARRGWRCSSASPARVDAWMGLAE
ncbi:MAG: hypothetical protein IT297_08980 [Anaerolineae bacterium]|nr:hypothetical protein [Anaerolineae bacterium]